jgi:hypothetical protein
VKTISHIFFDDYKVKPPLGRCGGTRLPVGCPLHTSPTVKLMMLNLSSRRAAYDRR